MKGKITGKCLLSLLLAGSVLLPLASCGRKQNEGDTTTGTSPAQTGGTNMENDPNANTSKDGLTVSALKVNQTSSALGIDTDPVFSWTVSRNGFGGMQTAYQLKISSSAAKAEAGEADVWDSGKTDGSSAAFVAYTGEKKLTSATSYYWTVTVWDVTDDSVTSKPALLRTGMLDQADWKGEWITAAAPGMSGDVSGANWIWDNGATSTTTANAGYPAATYRFRAVFTADKDVRSAVLAYTADDYGDFYVNGEKVCSVPNQTDIWKTGNLVDVTEQIKKGENLLAAQITNSSNGYAGLVAKLSVVYTDGSEDSLVTDGKNWKLSKENADGWQNPGFDDRAWSAPTQVVGYGGSPWGNQATFSSGDSRAAHYLRREFSLSKPVSEATAYVCGLGLFELTVNGKTPDDSLLNPCNTQYSQTVLYRAFDVTSLLGDGANAIGVELGNGFYNEQSGVWNWGSAEWRDDPKLLLNLVIRYTDGSEETVATGTDWQGTVSGPTTFNSIYYGERYDARLEMNGWNKPGFSAGSGWSAASKADAPKGKLVCQIEDPIRRTATFKPKSIQKLSDGSYVVTAPEYVTGWASLTIRGAKAGDSVRITYAEKQNKNGSVVKMGASDVSGSWWPEFNIQTDTYTCKGGESETFEPKFSYKGFNYFQIWGYPGDLTEDDITIYRVSNDVEVTGSFETSDALLNTLHHMAVISSENNLQGKPTDCPVWEKNGWLGDCNVMLQSLSSNFDLSNFLPNYVEIMEDCFNEYKLVPQMVPTAGWGVADHYVWNTVYVFAVEELWDRYGMDEYVSEQYATMSSYAKKIQRTVSRTGYIADAGQLGDWVSPMGGKNDPYNESPNEGSAIVGTAYLYKMYTAMARMADHLGKSGDAETFRSTAEKIKEAFNEKFYNKKGYYESSTWNNNGPKRTKFRQTSQLVALSFGLVPDENKEAVVKSLVDDIVSKDYHLDTGCVGAKEILPVLCDCGYADVAYKIVTQKTYPSWGFMYEQGSTSLWEMWETTARSLGHYFLGSYDEWFYSHLAGISDVREGYESYTVDPVIPDGLDYVTCTQNTVRGALESSWKKGEDGKITFKLTVPYGSTATVYLPAESADQAHLGSAVLSDAITGIRSVTTENGRVCAVLSAGSYEITVG